MDKDSLNSLVIKLRMLAGQMDELKNNPRMIYLMGQSYYDGDDQDGQDLALAAGWYKLASDLGNSSAQHNLALMYEAGEGVDQSFEEAFKYYTLAADKENSASLNNLGILYESGHGVTKDFAKALNCYQRSASAGNDDGADNYRRLKSIASLENDRDYRTIFMNSAEVLSSNVPLGDCATLPYSKSEILHALCMLRQECELLVNTNEDEGISINSEIEESVSLYNMLLTKLVTNWHEIEDRDKALVDELKDYEEFPGWAEHLRDKYINEEIARVELMNATLDAIIEFRAQNSV